MVAFLQIIVYAGAIMVLFLFVIMLLNLQTDPPDVQHGGLRRMACIGGAILVAELFLLLRRAPTAAVAPRLPEDFGTVQSLGRKLFTDYLLPFEVTGVLLLIAVVGAVVLARRQA